MEHDSLDSKVHLVRIIFIEVVVAHTDSQPAGGLPVKKNEKMNMVVILLLTHHSSDQR